MLQQCVSRCNNINNINNNNNSIECRHRFIIMQRDHTDTASTVIYNRSSGVVLPATAARIVSDMLEMRFKPIYYFQIEK